MVVLVQEIGTATDLLGVFRALRTYAATLTGANALFVSLLEDVPGEGLARRCVYAWVDGAEIEVDRLPVLPMTGGPHATAVATGEVVISEDLQSEIADVPNVALAYDLDPRAPRVSIALPLAVLGHVIGGFEVQIHEHRQPRSCVPGLQLAANLAAVTLDNLRLLNAERAARETAERAQRELRELNEALEWRVGERTRELAESVRRLEALSDDLEQVSQRKSEFLASMSHELRTPLNAIIGFSEVLLDHATGGISEEQRATFIGHVHGSGKHLLELINDILDLSKVEAGRLELFRATVSVAELIDGCASMMRVVAERKGISLVTQCEPADACASVDPARFKQVVYNLLSNAIKFTPSGGHVRVDVHVTDATVRLVVHDDGMGITLEDQALIFEPFIQVRPLTPLQQEGTGLGLALVRKLVELHEGSVELESAPGMGSRFIVSVPR